LKQIIDPFGSAITLHYDYAHGMRLIAVALYRACDSRLGRWINRDPLEGEGGLNLCAYVRGSGSIRSAARQTAS